MKDNKTQKLIELETRKEQLTASIDNLAFNLVEMVGEEEAKEMIKRESKSLGHQLQRVEYKIEKELKHIAYLEKQGKKVDKEFKEMSYEEKMANIAFTEKVQNEKAQEKAYLSELESNRANLAEILEFAADLYNEFDDTEEVVINKEDYKVKF